MSKSPFPGMDPYLEPHWLDVHQRLATYLCDQIQDRLPPDLCARMEERVILEDDGGSLLGSRHPDVRVIEEDVPGGSVAVAVDTAVASPSRVVVDVSPEPFRETFVEIVDAKTRGRVITCIELVSPTNKRPGNGLDVYVEKQAECRAGRVNLVEIDLTRAGNRHAIFPWLAKVRPQPTYLASVRRAETMQRVELHEFPLDKPLKPIRIPLRATDQDVILELQPLIAQAYVRGRYGNTDYSRPLDPPLLPAEAEFAERVLKESGKR
ncbi:MAG: DUF4058 family protein [Pirellulaceae bacterium]